MLQKVNIILGLKCNFSYHTQWFKIINWFVNMKICLIGKLSGFRTILKKSRLHSRINKEYINCLECFLSRSSEIVPFRSDVKNLNIKIYLTLFFSWFCVWERALVTYFKRKCGWEPDSEFPDAKNKIFCVLPQSVLSQLLHEPDIRFRLNLISADITVVVYTFISVFLYPNICY